MADKKENRVLVYEDEMRAKFMEGAKAGYDAVAVTYGPKGKNVLLERGFGRPTYTRDGLTIIEQVFFSDRPKNMGTQALAEASRSANNISGDGSSATVVLTYHTLANAVKAVASGQHPMDVSDTITRDGQILLEALQKLVIPVKDEQLKEVATVSAGNPAIGQLIAEAILYVGQDGGILTEKAPITEIEREYIDGYYLQSGFTALQTGKKELIDPYVIVSSKRLSSAADAIEILNGVMKANNLQQGQIPRILFVGNIEDAAYTTIVNTINQGQIDAVIIKTPPMYGELGKYLLSDIALYAGCELISENTNIKQFVRIMQDAKGQKYASDYIGSVSKVVASKSESTIFGDNETEAVQTRIAEIKDAIAMEDIPAIAEKLKDRVAKLEGKIAIFKIGGINDSVKEELDFRIDDAINSTRHAHREGIVAGGGVTLLELSKLKTISDITRNALRSTFEQLLINANLPSQLKLDEALRAPKGYGYNLKESGELVDMVKLGIIDPFVVTREAISNSIGATSNAIKIGMGITFSDEVKG
ncbi:GroL Chaperonin GroEL (HSP60 family) [uncultured Caudovirales phage]|uniref:GroL Chaperonin GroEL (HSP60 family) n=1 Tax=uncultured Caudovirales phage TaxID=2100421 RepID=A0A6J5LHE3_9CAUD|nr:GroL Chaperonin GroEL (HSP60 family) [uncultured Caudovirales phage]